MDKNYYYKSLYSSISKENEISEENFILPKIKKNENKHKNLLINTMEHLNMNRNVKNKMRIMSNKSNNSFFNDSIRLPTESSKYDKFNIIKIDNTTNDTTTNESTEKKKVNTNLILKHNRNLQDEMLTFYTQKQIITYLHKYESDKRLNISKIKYKTIEKPSENKFNYKPISTKDMKFSREQSLNTFQISVNYLITTIKPSIREGCSMILYDYTLFLISGLSYEKDFNIWSMNLLEQKWYKLNLKGDKLLSRFGHSSVLYKNEIFIFGGNLKSIFKSGEDIVIFNIKNNNLSTGICSNKKKLRWRKHHIAVNVGYHMFINGGYDVAGEILSDSFILDLNNLKWKSVDDDYKMNYKLGPLVHHSGCLVIHPDRKTNELSFNKLPDEFICTSINLKYEGIYVFGGLNSKNESLNNLRIITFGKKYTEIIEPEIGGLPPSPRFNSSLTFYDKLDILILHGGKNNIEVFNDTYVLDLYELNWIKINIKSNQPKERYGHCTVLGLDNLIIFGGMDNTKYMGSDLFFLEMLTGDGRIQQNDLIKRMKKKLTLNFKNNNYILNN